MTDGRRPWVLEFGEATATLRVSAATEDALLGAYRAFLADPRSDRISATLWDLREADLGTFGLGTLRTLGRALAEVPSEAGVDRSGGRSAVLVSGAVDFGHAGVVATSARDVLGVDIRVFAFEDEALAFLRGGAE